jgi:hypothetical protein
MPPEPPNPVEAAANAAVAVVNAVVNVPAGVPPPLLSPKEVYFVLKQWEPEAQTLKTIGFYVAKCNARVDHTVQKILKVGKEPALVIWCQRLSVYLDSIKRKKDFVSASIMTGSVIIVQRGAVVKDARLLRTQGGFAELEKYLLASVKDQIWPERRNTNGEPFSLDYYGSESYVGPLLSHLPHGSGRRTYTNGESYMGDFALGQRHGQGRMVFRNGDTYDGAWVEDLKEGSGKMIEAASGNVYEGGWLANRKHGKGVTHWERAQEAEKLCRVCYENGAETCFYDCGHVVACIMCAKKVDNCPICRKRVLSSIRLYYTV